MMKPVVLIILDGWGYSPEERGNAIVQARKPTFDMLERQYPFGYLQASGISVGLPWHEPGNSEVGHLALGTGRIKDQALERISKAIKSGEFYKNPALLKAAEHVRARNSALHLAGLFGSGSVHSYLDHLYGLLEFARQQNIRPVYLHLFLDGRDSPPKEGAGLIRKLEERLAKNDEGIIATVVGRHYALDRTFHWDRTEKAYRLMTVGAGRRVRNVEEVIREEYAKGTTDEFMEPLLLIHPEEKRSSLVQEGDALVFFEFREDSARQIAYSFAKREKVRGFTPATIKDVLILTMTEYEKGLGDLVIFPPEKTRSCLSELVSASGMRQFKIAETEKYAHITYFFNGGIEEPFAGEERRLIPSSEVTNFEHDPQMKASAIGEELISALKKDEYAFLLANFANADMLGHTGNMEAAIAGIETIDGIMSMIIQEVLARDGSLVITADHGNAESMLNLVTGETVTEHSTSPVPIYLVRKELRVRKSASDILRIKKEIHGVLPDVTATVLELLGIPKPPDILGTSLLFLAS